MYIYKDIFTEDELASDSGKMRLVDDLIYEFECKYVVRKDGEIRLAGANASAEGEDDDDGSDEHVERGLDIVLNHRLAMMNCYEDAATFKSYMKSFMKKILGQMEKEGKSAEEITAFKTKIQPWFVSILGKERFKTLQFFVGENMAEGRGDGQVVIVEYRQENDSEVPYMLLIKQGIVVEKQ